MGTPKGPRRGNQWIDDAMREQWWILYSQHAVKPSAISVRFGVHKHTVGHYISERKKREGVKDDGAAQTETL